LARLWLPLSGAMPREPKHPHSRAREAWRDQDRILSCASHGGVEGRFVALALAHRNTIYRVEDAAADLRVGVRRLLRLSLRVLGYSPSVIIGLARVSSVARSISGHNGQLKAIAAEHAYPGPAAMHRQFVRYLGVAPSILSKNSAALSEIDNRKRAKRSGRPARKAV